MYRALTLSLYMHLLYSSCTSTLREALFSFYVTSVEGLSW